jgi:hypothetical protein
MIRIFNDKEKKEILIDDSLSNVIVTPHMYIEPCYIKIEINGFFMLNHMSKCSDCKSFVYSFGKSSNNWFLEYKNKKYLINTDKIGSKINGENKIQQTTYSEYNNGTTLVLSIMELDIQKLNEMMLSHQDNEEYEKCIIFRDLIENAKI